MGKTVLAEIDVQENVAKLIDEQGFIIGLTVGKCSHQRDAALHLIPTPGEQGEEGESGNTPSAGPDSICEQWIAEHARQVTCMLPGGIGVVGVFFICHPNQAAAAMTKARQALFAIHKLLTKRQLLSTSREQDSMEWSVMHVCRTTRKTTCKTINVLDHKCTPRPAELKFQTSGHKWSSVQSSLHLDIGIHLPARAADCSQYSKQLLSRLSPVTRMIEGAIALVDGQLRSGTDALESQQGKKKSGKKGGGSANEGGTHIVELLTDRNDVMSKTKDVERSTVQAQIHIVGSIASRAFVDTKATVTEAVQAIKEDLIRSVHARFDLLGSELRQSSGDQEVKETQIAPPAVIATPRRILARLHSSPIVVSDYAFAEEQAAEIAERMSELLNVEVSEEDLDLETEVLPDEALLEAKPVLSEEGEETIMLETAASTSSLRYMSAAAVGVLGALLAGAMSYLAITDD